MMIQYRHLYFKEQDSVKGSAFEDAEKACKEKNEILNTLKELGYPIRDLIEDVKEQYKKESKYKHIIVFTDGGVRNHHDSTQASNAASAFVLYGDKKFLKQKGRHIGKTYRLPKGEIVPINSTLAEYDGLLEGMSYLINNGIVADKYTFVTDCSIMMEQINNNRKTSNHNFIECKKTAQKYMSILGNIQVKHVTRDKNRQADALVNQILNEQERVVVPC